MSSKLVFVLIVAGPLAVMLSGSEQPWPVQNPAPPQAREAAASPASDSNAACAAFEAKPGRPVWPEIPNAEMQLALVQSLERRLASAGTADTPGILLELGRAKARFASNRNTPQASYAGARSGEFSYNEVGGNWIYRGRELQ